MIVCICNALNEKKLSDAARQASMGTGCGTDSDVSAFSGDAPTVAEVFRICGERPQCGKCLSHVAQIIEEIRPEHTAIKVAAE